MRKTLFLFLVFAFLLVASPLFAQVEMMGGGQSTGMMIDMGPTIAGRMLHAWVSLLAAIAIFILAFKYLARGALARPIFFIGLGALIDAFLGLFPPTGEHTRFMWLGVLLFSASVVVGILWMAKIFGVFQSVKKENS